MPRMSLYRRRSRISDQVQKGKPFAPDRTEPLVAMPKVLSEFTHPVSKLPRPTDHSMALYERPLVNELLEANDSGGQIPVAASLM